MSESKRGVVAPRRSRGPYETSGLEIDSADLGRLAEYIATTYPSEATSKMSERVEALDSDRKAATLLGEALVQIVSEAAQDHRSKQHLLEYLLGDIRRTADQKIFGLDHDQRPREDVIRLDTGQPVSFVNEGHYPDHGDYMLNLKSGAVAGSHHWREEYSIKLTDVQEQISLELPASRTLRIEDHIRQDLIRDGQSSEYLAQVTRVRQENRPGYDPDCYHWSTYWLPENNDLLASWEEYQSEFNESVRGHILEAIARQACIKCLESSISGNRVQQIRLAHTTPASLEGAEALFRKSQRSDSLPEEVRPDASIKALWQPHRSPDSLQIELWQQRKDKDVNSSFLGFDLGRRTHINLDSRGQADIYSLAVERSFPSIDDSIRY